MGRRARTCPCQALRRCRRLKHTGISWPWTQTKGAATGSQNSRNEAGVTHTGQGWRSDSPSLTECRCHSAPGSWAPWLKAAAAQGEPAKGPLPWAPTRPPYGQHLPAEPRRRGTHPLALHRARHLVVVQVSLEFGRHGRSVPRGSVPGGRSLEGRADKKK